MKLHEINNEPNIYATGAGEQKEDLPRKDARAIAGRLRRQADKQNPNTVLPNKVKSRFITWLGQQMWTRDGQNDQPMNVNPNLGPKIKWN